MNEKPIDRLNYFNGQRLEASDLKLEQEYHIRVRRWLNKSLYSAGIARGLEVRAETLTPAEQKAGKKLGPRVVVSPGLALDADGHEIILWDEERLCALGEARHQLGAGSDAVVEGLYLTIRYNEEVTAVEKDGCEVSSASAPCGNRPAWGGPTRVRAKPLFAWRSFLPPESSGEILLALVELEPGCTAVHQIDAGVRRYVGAASAAKVRQYALEGERHIDKDNPGRIYFHIRGRQPNAVALYLRAERFSTLYYTELGKHDHGLNVGTALETSAPQLHIDASNPDKYRHSHSVSELTTRIDDPTADGSHTDHKLLVSFSNAKSTETSKRIVVAEDLGLALAGAGDPVCNDILPVLSEPRKQFVAKISQGTHAHTIAEFTTSKESVVDDHYHTFSPNVSMDPAGIVDVNARTGKNENALTYADDLQIWIGKTIDDAQNKTVDVRRQLQAAQSTEDWSKLGGGSESHALAAKGTGAIRLDFLPGVDFTAGEYIIELRVASGGGRILYNLYIE